MNDGLLYPDATRPQTLMQEITACLGQLTCVEHIFIFGSLARQESDRWSDIDMIVITPTEAEFCLVLDALNEAKPILYHHPLSIQPMGGHALGNIFVGESIFHCLDLNFMTHEDYQVAGALDRFGMSIEVHAGESQHSTGDKDEDCASQEILRDEKRIAYGMHSTKKNLKRVLRGSPDLEELSRYLNILKEVMQDYPEDYCTIGGKIGQVAHAYIHMAETLLKKN